MKNSISEMNENGGGKRKERWEQMTPTGQEEQCGNRTGEAEET